MGGTGIGKSKDSDRVSRRFMFCVSIFSVMPDREFVRPCVDGRSDATCTSALLSSRRFLTNSTMSRHSPVRQRRPVAMTRETPFPRAA